jgi:hypothetical protein
MNEAVEAYFLDNQEFVEGQVRCNHWGKDLRMGEVNWGYGGQNVLYYN